MMKTHLSILIFVVVVVVVIVDVDRALHVLAMWIVLIGDREFGQRAICRHLVGSHLMRVSRKRYAIWMFRQKGKQLCRFGRALCVAFRRRKRNVGANDNSFFGRHGRDIVPHKGKLVIKQPPRITAILDDPLCVELDAVVIDIVEHDKMDPSVLKCVIGRSVHSLERLIGVLIIRCVIVHVAISEQVVPRHTNGRLDSVHVRKVTQHVVHDIAHRHAERRIDVDQFGHHIVGIVANFLRIRRLGITNENDREFIRPERRRERKVNRLR